jgi:diguanylate cyclase (GGDEF)-like protein
MNTLNLITLSFQNNALEKSFILSTQDRTRYQGQIAIFVGMFVYILCGLLDQWFVPPELADEVWNIRFTALSVPVIVLLLSLTPIFTRFNYSLLAIVGLAAGVGLISIQMLLPIESTPYYYPMMIVVAFYTYNFIGTRFIYALAVDLFLLVSYNVIFGWVMDFPLHILVSHDAFIVSANLIGGAAGYLTEWQRRILFLRELELEEERKLHLHRALHDPLTGLPNRDLVYERIEQSIKMTRREKGIHCAFFLDLDGFKAINDNLGHKTGDSVLKEVAQRISSVFREIDTVARVGGDEFFVLALNIGNEEKASDMAKKILDQISRPIPKVPAELSLSVSIGMCLFPYEGMSTSNIIHRADKAMYKVKSSGKGNFLFAK